MCQQVILPLGLQREVDGHLKAYLSKNPMRSGSFSDNSLSSASSVGNVDNDEGFYKQQEPSIPNSAAMEKIFRPKSLQLRSKQQIWQVCRKPRNLLEYFLFSLVILSGTSAFVIFHNLCIPSKPNNPLISLKNTIL